MKVQYNLNLNLSITKRFSASSEPQEKEIFIAYLDEQKTSLCDGLS